MASKQMSLTERRRLVAEFNKICAVGARVSVRLDDGSTVDTVTTAPAEILGGHTPVVWLKDISGAYLLTRVKVLSGRADAQQ
jgi:hypothetical protein